MPAADKKDVMTGEAEDNEIIDVVEAPAPGQAPANDRDTVEPGEGDEADEGDERLAHDTESDDERHERRRSRRERQRAAKERSQRELTALRETNQILVREVNVMRQRMDQADRATLEQRITEVQRAEQLAEAALTKAITDRNAENQVRAQKLRDEAKDRLKQLQGYKQQIEHNEAAATNAQERPRLDPNMARLGAGWMERHKWYDPDLGDEDSMIVNAIDTSLLKSGMNPTTEEYWKELSRRVKTRLPHKFKSGNGNGKPPADDLDDDDDEPRDEPRDEQRRGPGVGGSSRGNSGNANNRRTVNLSRERIQALKDAGVWDDPPERARFIRRFEEYDREQRKQRQ